MKEVAWWQSEVLAWWIGGKVTWWHNEGGGMVAWWHVQHADCGMSARLPPVEHTVPGHQETAEPLIVSPVSGHAAWPRILLCIRLVDSCSLHPTAAQISLQMYCCTAAQFSLQVLCCTAPYYSAVHYSTDLLLCCSAVLFCLNLVQFGGKHNC